MITEVFPIEINGVKYRIDESMEQSGYVLHRQPLRAPVNGFIQGESGRFQLRSDLLEWSLTDWSGGEGYAVFDPETPDRYSVGYNIDPFTIYGTLRLSRHAVEIPVAAGAEALETSHLVVTLEALHLVDQDRTSIGARVRKWDSINNEWDVVDTDSFGAANVEVGLYGAWGTAQYMFFGTGNGVAPRRWDGTTFVSFVTALDDTVLAEVNGFLYTAQPVGTGLKIKEANIAGTPPVSQVTVATLTGVTEGAYLGAAPIYCAVAGSNALFVMANPTLADTTIWRITPTTAAGAGFGVELLRLPGFRGLTLVFILGVLYAIGLEGNVFTIMAYDETLDEFSVLYRNTERVATHTSAPSRKIWEAGSTFGHEFSKAHFVAIGGPNNTNGGEWSVMTIDGVAGAVAGGTVLAPGGVFDDAIVTPSDLTTGDGLGRHIVAMFKGDIFVALNKASNFGTTFGSAKTYRLAAGTYTTNTGIMEGPLNDFNVSEKKVLLSLHLDTEPLPANTSVVVKYQIDQSGTWVTAGTHSTDGENEAIFTVSTGSATVEFNNLQLRLELTTTDTTVTPVVLRIATRAAVVKGVRVWDLLLDASDEDGQMQDRSWNGTTLMTNIATAGDNGTVVTLKDGYRDRNVNSFSTHNVVVDEYRILGDRPGEGHVMVRLRETT